MKLSAARQLGGRQLRNRLFSTEEVYRTAMKNELVKLGIRPSQATKQSTSSGRTGARRTFRRDGKSTRCCGRAMISGVWRYVRKNFLGDHYINLGKSKSTEDMDLPKQAFAVIPISDVLGRISSKLSELLGETKDHGGERDTITNLASCMSSRWRRGHLP